MNRFVQAFALVVLLCTAHIYSASAQTGWSKWQIGVNGGIMVYQGDLTPSDLGSYKTMKPTFGAYISRVLSPSLLLRTNLAVGKLYGDDAKYSSPAWRQERNYKFTTPVTEVSELLVWNISGNSSNELGQRFSPYVFGGLGVSFLNIKRDTTAFNAHYFASSTSLVN